MGSKIPESVGEFVVDGSLKERLMGKSDNPDHIHLTGFPWTARPCECRERFLIECILPDRGRWMMFTVRGNDND